MNLLLWLALSASAAFQATEFGLCPAQDASAPDGGGHRSRPLRPGEPPVRYDFPPPVQPVNAAPDFRVEDVMGRPFQLAEQRGKVVLLDFWATWCGPCKLSTPLLIDLHKRYKDRGLIVLGLNAHESWDTVTDYVAQRGMDYRVAIDEGAIAAQYRVRGYPTFVLIGKDGLERGRLPGFGPDSPARLVELIEAALK